MKLGKVRFLCKTLFKYKTLGKSAKLLFEVKLKGVNIVVLLQERFMYRRHFFPLI